MSTTTQGNHKTWAVFRENINGRGWLMDITPEGHARFSVESAEAMEPPAGVYFLTQELAQQVADIANFSNPLAVMGGRGLQIINTTSTTTV